MALLGIYSRLEIDQTSGKIRCAGGGKNDAGNRAFVAAIRVRNMASPYNDMMSAIIQNFREISENPFAPDNDPPGS